MQSAQAIRILVVDYHSIVCIGISVILDKYQEFEVVAQAESGPEALQLCERLRPDIVAIDIDLPDCASGLELIRKLRAQKTGMHIVVLTNNSDEEIIQGALRAGATSYLLKNVPLEELAHAIRSAAKGISTLSPEVTQALIQPVMAPSQESGNNHLTRREQQVLELVSMGLTNHEIAEELNISFSTVQFHVRNILAKLGVHNRIEAATIAVRQSLKSHKGHSTWLIH